MTYIMSRSVKKVEGAVLKVVVSVEAADLQTIPFFLKTDSGG